MPEPAWLIDEAEGGKGSHRKGITQRNSPADRTDPDNGKNPHQA
jgi:hypothetical protein